MFADKLLQTTGAECLKACEALAVDDFGFSQRMNEYNTKIIFIETSVQTRNKEIYNALEVHSFIKLLLTYLFT